MHDLLDMTTLDRIRDRAGRMVERSYAIRRMDGEASEEYAYAAAEARTATEEADKAVRRWIAEEPYRVAVVIENLRVLYPMLNIPEQTQGYLEEQLAFAMQTWNRRSSLIRCLNIVTRGKVSACTLFKDFAPHSFTFQNDLFFGGIIYYEPEDKWSVHT